MLKVKVARSWNATVSRYDSLETEQGIRTVTDHGYEENSR